MDDNNNTTQLNDIKTLLCWLPYEAGVDLQLGETFHITFEQQYTLPILLSGADLERYREDGNIAVTAHTLLTGILDGYRRRIPMIADPEPHRTFMAKTLRRLVAEKFGRNDFGNFICGVAGWLRESVGLGCARQALGTAVKIDPLHAGLRNDYIGTCWQMAEEEENQATQADIFHEIIEAYCHQFLGEIRQNNLEMSSYFFCCSLLALGRWELPEEREWYIVARRNISTELLLQKLDRSESGGFSMEVSRLLNAEPVQDEQEPSIYYGNYWWAVLGDDAHEESDYICSPEVSWRTIRYNQEVVAFEGEDKKCEIYCGDYPPDTPLRYLNLTTQSECTALTRTMAVYPYCADGAANLLVINEVVQLDEHVGYVRAATPNEGAVINFFDPLFMMDRMSLVKGSQISIKLGALAMSLAKADPGEFDITSGPLLDIERQRRQEEDPNFDPAMLTSVKYTMAGSAICLHSREQSFEAEIRATVQEVGWFHLHGREICKMRVHLLAPDGDTPVACLIYAAPHILEGYRPEPGDDIEGVVWLQGYIDRTARELIDRDMEAVDQLAGVDDAVKIVLEQPGLAAGLFDVLAESPYNQAVLRVRTAYVMARLVRHAPEVLSPFVKYLSGYLFHDEPVEVWRQFAQLLPYLVMDLEHAEEAWANLWHLYESQDDATRLLALRSLMVFPCQEIIATPAEQSLLQCFADGADPAPELARYYYDRANYEMALKAVDAALDSYPDNEDIWNLKALILFNGYDDGAGALECLDHVSMTEGSKSGKSYLQGVVSYFQGNYPGAIQFLDLVDTEELKIERQFQYHVLRAMVAEKLCQTIEAVDCYLKSMALYDRCNPNDQAVIYYKNHMESGIERYQLQPKDDPADASESDWPLIYTPQVLRSKLNYKGLDQTPECASDLPARMPMGDIIPDTFSKIEEGFEVQYRSGDFSMTIKSRGEICFYTEYYKNTQLLQYMGPSKQFIGPRLTQLRIAPEEEAERRIGEDLKTLGNIHFVPFEAFKGAVTSYYPDGYLMSIVIPMGIRRDLFGRLTDFFRQVPDDGTLCLDGSMEFTPHVVNYRFGRCTDVPFDPIMLYLWSAERGYPPISLPVIEGKVGNQALTLRRMGYNLVLNVFMRDLFRVVQMLKHAGLIGDNNRENQEETALVTYANGLMLAKDWGFFSRDESRRIVFLSLMDNYPDLHRPSVSQHTFRHQLDEVLEKYQGGLEKVMAAFGSEVAHA